MKLVPEPSLLHRQICPVCRKEHTGLTQAGVARQIDSCRAGFFKQMNENPFRRADDREKPVQGTA